MKIHLPAFLKTTAFKLTAIYMGVFVIFSIVAVGYIAYTAGERLKRQLDNAITSEITGFSSNYQRLGIRGLLDHVQSRSQQPGAPALLITNFQGRLLAGNIPSLPAGFLQLDRNSLHPLPYDRTDPTGEVESTLAMVRIFDLPGGFNLVIGRDIGEREEFKRIISGFVLIALAALALLGFLSWYLVGRRVLYRIDRMSATSQKIVAGNLSERLAVEGSGDEFDRLAGNVNNMLNRIEGLMAGLKDVSDNIAHDLKTPLTRMRNRIESVLAGNADEAELRSVLETTISESDHLIRIFDALLRIARVEAGSAFGSDGAMNLNQVLADIVELYEPVAEEAGIMLRAQVQATAIIIKANRELISQAVANLIDNALKYARAANGQEAKIDVTLRVAENQALICIADNGPGIDEKDYSIITKRFTRLERSRSLPGSGLGLSLVSAVAKFHGGTLSFGDNQPGLIVTLSLPLHGV